MKNGYLRTTDAASIYYEIDGEGQPLVLVHGWACSSKFWQKNVPTLKKHFKVVTLDLRNHGKSSKGLHGCLISRIARDIHELILYLDLKNVILMGWSMGGPTMLSYWQQFQKDGLLAGLGLIDMTPFPLSDGDWNSHGFRNYNTEAFNSMISAMNKDQEGFVNGFVKKIFKDSKQPAGTQWVNEECMKAPTASALAFYSDYIYSDFTTVLKTITIPVIVFSADSNIFPHSIKQGQYIASQIPHAKFIPFEHGGHMLFYIEYEKFNNAILDFAQHLK
ncbi:MAG: alpha/beta hydrolase [Acidaminococcaceae bacterium]|nr:alpha/beta hydrolase [Acidaminococcaceae bacterium]